MLLHNTLGAALCAFALTSLASADVITGRVVDWNGQPVFDVDIDMDNIGSGGDPTITGDHTDVNGLFSIVVPAGLYDVGFFPPAPPASNDLVRIVENVSVVGTKNMGDIVLPRGHALTGRVLGVGGAPVVGLDFDVVVVSTGDVLDMTNDLTNALGQFSIAIADEPCLVQFDGSSGLGALLVSQELELDLSADLALGDVQFAPGFVMTGRVVNSALVGVFNADLDVYDPAGELVFTPGDNTNALGNFSVVVPAGILGIEICPLFSSPVAGVALQTTVAGATNIGNIVAPPAVTLSGVVTNALGAPVTSGDVDLRDPTTGEQVYICYDEIKPGGTYALRAPVGVYDVVMEPLDFSQPIGADIEHSFSLNTSKTLNGVLPDCPFPTTYGTGTVGAGGFVPTMGYSGGAPRHRNSQFALTVGNTVGGAFGYVFVGFGPANFPLGNATALIDPFLPYYQFAVLADGAPGVAGAGTAVLPLPVHENYIGITIYAQSVMVDASLIEFLSVSNAITTTFCQ